MDDRTPATAPAQPQSFDPIPSLRGNAIQSDTPTNQFLGFNGLFQTHKLSFTLPLFTFGKLRGAKKRKQISRHIDDCNRNHRIMTEGLMWNRNQIVNAKYAEYATSADFCQIFDKDMSSLYLLSLLLTGDHKKAEECFVAGLENAVDRNRVFKDWARGWARRVIIQNALRTVDPHPKKESILNSASIEANDKTAAERPEIAAVLGFGGSNDQIRWREETMRRRRLTPSSAWILVREGF